MEKQEQECQTYTYKTVGDLAIHADVYRPDSGKRRRGAGRRPQSGTHPVIMWIHGGALIMGGRDWVPLDQVERFLDAGWTVVSIDYRLAPETKLDAILSDVRDAYGWIREKGPGLFDADPEHIAVAGGSAGGYLSLSCGVMLEPKPRCIVSYYGYGEIVGDWYSKPDGFYLSTQDLVPEEQARAAVGGVPLAEGPPETRGQFYLYCRQRGAWPLEVTGLDYEKEPEKFVRYCPDQNVNEDYPPTMLLHGDEDTDVPFLLSERMAASLEKAGVQHELVRMKGMGHGFDGVGIGDERFALVFARVMEFMERHLES